MKAWSSFLSEVRPSLAGIPENMAENAVRRSAQELCRKTRCWRVVLDATTTIAGIDVYDLELPTRSELVRLENAKLNGQDKCIGRIQQGRPVRDYVYCDDGRTLVFSLPPSTSAPLVMTCSLAPSDKATGVEDYIGDRYSEVIALGAVAIASNDANKRADFDARVAHIRVTLWKGNSGIAPRSIPNFF